MQRLVEPNCNEDEADDDANRRVQTRPVIVTSSKQHNIIEVGAIVICAVAFDHVRRERSY